MLFWIIATALALLCTMLLIIPLLHNRRTQGENEDVAIYRDQLAEVERDLERGVLDAADAERVRTEISRRLLSADKAEQEAPRQAPRGATIALAMLTGVSLIGGSLAGYYGTDRMLRAAGMSEIAVRQWQETLSISFTLTEPFSGTNFNFWASPVFSGIGAPGYPDIPLASRIAASEEVRETRMSQLEAEGLAAQLPLRPEVPPAVQERLDGLQSIVDTDPNDVEIWQQIVALSAEVQQFSVAARAQQQVLALTEDQSPGENMRLAILMILAAEGYVSPEAEGVLQTVLEVDPSNIPARYYYGLLFYETDRPDRAFILFRDVINEGTRDNPFVQMAMGLVEEAAFRAGVEYTLPPAPGPSVDDMIAAQDLSEEDRANMIADMVNRLSDRLANEGGPVEDWARLINALAVLGDTEQANAILFEARILFASSPEAMEQLDFVAGAAGLDP